MINKQTNFLYVLMTLIKFRKFNLKRLKQVQRVQWEKSYTPCIIICAKFIFFEVIQFFCKQDAFQIQAFLDTSLTLIKVV